MPKSPVLLVHGGAWAMPEETRAAHQAGVQNALAAGYALLAKGCTAVDAVEAAVAVLEDDETFDAGRGSFLTREGTVQLDALLMDGGSTGTLRAGGVACVERLLNPIHAARVVLDHSPHVYFVGRDAETFVSRHGIQLVDNRALVIERELQRLAEAQRKEQAGLPDDTFSGAGSGTPSELASHDTVGAVALDANGNLAAATSTGGTLNKQPGRIGDSSLIGCGCYADNESAAVSLTGWGEPIMKLVLGKWAVDRVETGQSPEEAANAAIAYLYRRMGGHGGMILLAPDGRFGIAHNTPQMAWGVCTAGGTRTGIDIAPLDAANGASEPS